MVVSCFSWQSCPRESKSHEAVFGYSHRPELLMMHQRSIEKISRISERRSTGVTRRVNKYKDMRDCWKCYSNLGRWEMLHQHTEMLMSTDYVFFNNSLKTLKKGFCEVKSMSPAQACTNFCCRSLYIHTDRPKNFHHLWAVLQKHFTWAFQLPNLFHDKLFLFFLFSFLQQADGWTGWVLFTYCS